MERRLEMSISGATADVAKGGTKLAFFGLANLVLLVAAIVVIVLLIKLVV